MNEGLMGLLGGGMSSAGDLGGGLLNSGFSDLGSGLFSGLGDMSMNSGLLNSGFMSGLTPQSDFMSLGTSNFSDLSNMSQIDPSTALPQSNDLFGGLFNKDGLFNSQNLKGMSTLAKLGGGLYQGIQKEKLIDEAVKASQATRATAEDEKNRRNDFINTTRKTLSGTSGATSNYYSA